MKIVYDYQIFSYQIPMGIARYYVELASELVKYADVRISVVSPIIRNLLFAGRREVPRVGIDLSQIPRLPDNAVVKLNALLFTPIAMKMKPDIVHETKYLSQAAFPKSTKIVTTIHDTIPERLPHYFPSSAEHRESIRRSLQRSTKVICVSESTRRDLLDLYDVNPSDVHVIPLGCSIRPSQDGPVDLGVPFFLHVGSRYPYKNFHGLVQAFGLSGLHRTHKLVSFSSQPFGAAEFAAIDNAEVPRSRVLRVSGNDDLLARYYAGADALVFPSLYEGFGIPLSEAMECSCPIITSSNSSMPEVAGDAAMYCEPTEPASISDAMLQMASTPDIRRDLIAKGLRRAKYFDWARCAAQTYRVYREALQS